MPSLDLFVYHDLDDTIHDELPPVGQDAGAWFGSSYAGLYITAIGPGVHAGRSTVVLSSESRHEMQSEIKKFFSARP